MKYIRYSELLFELLVFRWFLVEEPERTSSHKNRSHQLWRLLIREGESSPSSLIYLLSLPNCNHDRNKQRRDLQGQSSTSPPSSGVYRCQSWSRDRGSAPEGRRNQLLHLLDFWYCTKCGRQPGKQSGRAHVQAQSEEVQTQPRAETFLWILGICLFERCQEESQT